MKTIKSISTLGFILITFASQAVWVTFSPIITYVSQELNVGVELVGLLAVTYPIFFLILTIPSGILLDRNFKEWFFFGSLATFLSASGRLVSFNYWWLFFCQLLGALGQPFLLNAFVPFSSRLFEKNRRPFIISILSLSMYIGTVYSLATGVTLYNIGGLWSVITPISAISTLGIILILIGGLKIDFGEVEKIKALERLREVAGRKDLWILGGLVGLGVATFDNLATWLQPALKDVGLEALAGDAVAFTIIVGLIGIIFIPTLVSKRNIRTIYLRSITLLIMLFYIILIISVTKWLLFTLLPLSGLLMLPAYAIIMEWIEKFYGKEIHASATGFVGLVSRSISVVLTLGAMYFIISSSIYFTYLTIPLLLAFAISLILPRDTEMNKLRKTDQSP